MCGGSENLSQSGRQNGGWELPSATSTQRAGICAGRRFGRDLSQSGRQSGGWELPSATSTQRGEICAGRRFGRNLSQSGRQNGGWELPSATSTQRKHGGISRRAAARMAAWSCLRQRPRRKGKSVPGADLGSGKVPERVPERVPGKGACHPLGVYPLVCQWVMPSLLIVGPLPFGASLRPAQFFTRIQRLVSRQLPVTRRI